ncbi:MAG: O-antigen ligase family protein [Cyanobacteria bacterium P01_E01_bin.42]
MKPLYTILFALSIILINPWGQMRGEIWTIPKILILFLITFSNLIILLECRLSANKFPRLSRTWKIQLLLWGILLTCGLISTLKSPFPWHSFLGQEQMRDGWLYWLLLGGFTLSNTLLLQRYPNLFPAQYRGLILGGLFISLSIFPQILDWRIDYTATSGQLLQSNILASTIFRNQQPIGLYSHRGHASFVLAVVSTLTLLLWRSHSLSKQQAIALLSPFIAALFLTQTRMGILAFFGATAYILGDKIKKVLPFLLIGAIALGSWTTWRQIDKLSPLNQATSGRVGMWEQAIRGIEMRPVWGWGYNGHGIAHPYSDRWNPAPARVLRMDAISFTGEFATGKIQTRPIPTHKAHNLILDTVQSLGIVGFLAYFVLFNCYFFFTFHSPFPKLAAIALIYLIFTFTWFDCAQYSHLLWWSFSKRDRLS